MADLTAFARLMRDADTLSAVLLRIERRKDYLRRQYDVAPRAGTVDCPRCEGFIDWQGSGRSVRIKCRTPGCFEAMG